MEKVINFVFGLGNMFWKPFVVYLIYGWYFDEVGFELPQLTYLNVFALGVIVSLFCNNLDMHLLLDNKPDKENKNEYTSVASFLLYAMMLLISWVVYLILF